MNQEERARKETYNYFNERKEKKKMSDISQSN